MTQPVADDRPQPVTAERQPSRWRPVVIALAGPALIVGSVLAVLHAFAFSGLVSNQHTDVLALVLPTYCLLGKSLAAGHILAWNPYTLSGVPFAADPQSGWLYLPAMAVFSALPCSTALGVFIVLQPILAGLGLYWFLRGDGLSRPAATAGGLALAMLISDTRVALSLAFSGSLAWTALLLAAASWYLRARTAPSRLLRAIVMALAWGQVMAAYASNGLAIGTGALLIYLSVRLGSDVRAGRRSLKQACLAAAVPILAFPLINLAFLLPRIGYFHTTTLSLGYQHLYQRQALITGVASHPIPESFAPTWPLALIVPLGGYLGPTLLSLAAGGAWSRTRRGLWVGFALYGLVSYLLTLTVVYRWIQSHMAGWPLVDFYTHDPSRLRYPFALSVAILCALGVQAWGEQSSWRRRCAMLAPGAVTWLVLPLIFHVSAPPVLGFPWLLVAGLAAAPIVLGASARRRHLLLLVPALVALEVVANGMLGVTHPFGQHANGRFGSYAGDFAEIGGPWLDVASYLRPTRISRYLREHGGGRYLSYDPIGFRPDVGYLRRQLPRAWPLLSNGRSMLLGLQDTQGYNSIQPLRFWSFVRATGGTARSYNMDYYRDPTPQLMNLLDVRWVIARLHAPPSTPGLKFTPVLREGRYDLYRVDGSPGIASLVPRWRVIRTDMGVLRTVADPSFDPSRAVILQRAPGLPSGPGRATLPPGSARARQLGPQAIVASAHVTVPAVLLVRVPYDAHWHATVDGRPAPDLPADSVMQGIPVRPGTHTIRLSYDDPSIGGGLGGSAAALVLLLGAALTMRLRSRGNDPRE